MMESLSGYKTYMVAAAWLLYAGAGYFIGALDAVEAQRAFFEAFGLITLRLGIKKAEK